VNLVLQAAPDVVVIMIGANDVTRRVPLPQSVGLLGEAVGTLRDAGCRVVVGTCPDLGTIQPVRPPLRWVARRLSRRLAAAQTVAVVEAGGRTVSLGSLLGSEFASRPELFSADRFHPSAQGYATTAMALLPSLCASLGLWPEEDRPDRSRDEALLPVAVAAAKAASTAGTEVEGAAADGPAAGLRGHWALLKRRRHRLPEADADPVAAKQARAASPSSHSATGDVAAT
jgi:hypothetical protein